jgi:hypothetical protein
VITIDTPLSGSNVDAGATVRVQAFAAEMRPSDTGVKQFTYTVMGAAVESQIVIPVVVPLPTATPQTNPKLDFTFDVKDDLTSVDPTITIEIGAEDLAGNQCASQITITAGTTPDVVATLTWSGVEDLDVWVNINVSGLWLLMRPTYDGNNSCQGMTSPYDIVSLSGTQDAPLGAYYEVVVKYEKSCGAPSRAVPFSVRIQHDGYDFSVGDLQVSPGSYVKVNEFWR